MQSLSKLLVLTTVFLISFGVKAQVSITGIGQANAYTQNFNTLSATANAAWTNNSTLANWYAERTKGILTTLYAGNGNSTTPGLYNFGSTGSTDRSLGSIGSGNTGDYLWGVRLKNNTNVTITAFYVTFTGEQWYNSKSAAQALTVSYRTSNQAITSVTSGTWTAVPALSFTGPVKGGSTGSLDGNASANRAVVTYTITGISLPAGNEIMFRFADVNHKANDHGLAIDDLTIAALTPNQYYSKASGNLNLLTTWGTNTDGSGTAPASFTAQGQIFNIRNSATKTIGGNWTISGFGSKAILNNSGSAINFTIPATNSMTGILDIANAATLTINNTITPTIGSMAATSTIIYNNGLQTLAGGTYGNLTINGGGDKKLAAPVTVLGTLSFISGNIDLAENDLTLASGSNLSGASAANYVKTTSVGALTRMVSKGTTVAFPIGTASTYSPASISLTNNSTDDNFSASVAPKLSSSYDESNVADGSDIAAKVVNKTWTINEETDGGSNATVQLQWNAADELTGFNRTQSTISQFTNYSWNTSAFSAATGSGPYTRSLSGLSTFGVFGVTGQGAALTMAPLPVELLYFNAKANGNQAVLTWATASENNNEKFVIEQSTNGSDWTVTGEVKGNGTSATKNNYTFTCNAAANRVYYRLKQVDFDGTFNYSNIQAVTFSRKTENPVTLLANPVQEKVQFNLNGNNLGQATLEIYTAAGMLVNTQNLTESAAVNGTDISNLTPGVYIFRISGSQQVLGSGRLVKTN